MLDLDFTKMYLQCTVIEGIQKLQTDTQINATENISIPHTRVITSNVCYIPGAEDRSVKKEKRRCGGDR